MENILLHKFIKARRLKAELQEIINYVCSHPNIKLLDVSVSNSLSANRLTFTMLSPRNNSVTIASIKDLIRVIGFEEYLKIIQRIGNLLKKVLNTVRYPIHVIGFGFNRSKIKQLKVYYMLRIFDEETLGKEYLMGKIDKELSRKSIKKVLKKLDCDEQNAKVENILKVMSSENFELEFIGLNIEKDKSPSLKLYFKPKLKITAKRKEKPN